MRAAKSFNFDRLAQCDQGRVNAGQLLARLKELRPQLAAGAFVNSQVSKLAADKDPPILCSEQLDPGSILHKDVALFVAGQIGDVHAQSTLSRDAPQRAGFVLLAAGEAAN